MEQRERSLEITLQIDTNRINSRGHLANMNQLQQWDTDEVIQIEMSEVAHNEAIEGRDQRRTQKAFEYNFSKTLASGPKDMKLLREIEEALFPNGAKDANQKNDVEIIFNAYKYSDGLLVTADGNSKKQPGGILGNKEELRQLGIHVMTDEEAVSFVREKIKERDAHIVRRHEKFGTPLPEWLGKD